MKNEKQKKTFLIMQIVILFGILCFHIIKAWTYDSHRFTAFFVVMAILVGGGILNLLTWLSQEVKFLNGILSGIYSFWFLIIVCILATEPTLMAILQLLLTGWGICLFQFLNPFWKWKTSEKQPFLLKIVPLCISYTIAELTAIILLGIQERYDDNLYIPMGLLFILFFVSCLLFLFLRNSVTANLIIVSQFLLYGLLNFNFNSINNFFILAWILSGFVTSVVFKSPKSPVFHEISKKCNHKQETEQKRVTGIQI